MEGNYIKTLTKLFTTLALAGTLAAPALGAVHETDLGKVACGTAQIVAVECVRGIPGSCDTLEHMQLDPCSGPEVASDPPPAVPQLTCNELQAVLAVNCVYGNHLDCLVWEHPEYEGCRY